MEDNFDFIDFIQNKRLQQNLQEYDEKDAPEDVQDRVKKMAQAMVDPELGSKIVKAAFREEDSPYELFNSDPIEDAFYRCDEALQAGGWIPDGTDGDGCLFYKKAETRIKVRIAEEDDF